VVRKSGSLPNSFDFVIVGGGTAGCVLANRLSANPKNKVLLIESGGVGDNTLLTQIPVNWDETPFSPFDHGYINEGLEKLNWDGGKRHVAAGKGLGGTTLINTMMWVRGNRLDYDSWGVPGWSYNEVLPYFKRVETSHRYNNPDGAYYHGNQGPVHVGPSGWEPEEDFRLVEAANAWGLPFNPDWNGENQIGVGFHQHTIHNGVRVTAFSAYLQPILKRKNLYIMDNSDAHKINLKTAAKKITASSVLFVDNLTGKSYTVRATKEVIVSAGTLRSPQILQLSGIGPADELKRLGIPVVKNLPGVGKNLRDHPITTMALGTQLFQGVEGSELNEAAFENWRVNKTGVVASITARTNFFLRSDFATDARPDGQVIVTPPGWSAFALCYLNKPRSTGHVRLFSKDPTDIPRVTANYFQHPDDLEAMIDIMNKTLQIMSRPPIKAYPYSPAYDMTDKAKLTAYILGDASQWIAANAGSGYHFTGTNRMGDPSKDPTVVVDNHLRVIGVQGLRVADASIFPDIPTGNTQYPTYMVGEKASDIILKDWKLI